LDFQFLQLSIACINDKYITKHVMTCFPLISCDLVHSSSLEFVNSKINYLFSLILECFLQAGWGKMRILSPIRILLSISHFLFYWFQDIRRGWHFTNSTIMDQIMTSTAQTDLTKIYKRFLLISEHIAVVTASQNSCYFQNLQNHFYFSNKPWGRHVPLMQFASVRKTVGSLKLNHNGGNTAMKAVPPRL